MGPGSSKSTLVWNTLPVAASTGSPKSQQLAFFFNFPNGVWARASSKALLALRKAFVLASALSPSFMMSWKRSIVGGPPTSTGLPAEVMTVSSWVGSISEYFGFLNFPGCNRGGGGKP